MAWVYAFVTVVAWGTWLAPSQNVRFSGQQVRAFYVSVANILISGSVAAWIGLESLTGSLFGLAFTGGVVWALGGWAAFAAADRIGLVRAYGIWAPLNIIVSVLFGALLFDEFVSLNTRAVLILLAALALIIGGVLMIIFAKGGQGERIGGRTLAAGLGCAFAAGVFWAAYYIPIKVSKASMWVASFPMACGMFAGCLAIVLLSRKSLKLDRPADFLRTGLSGLLWACGNYGMLLLVQALGSGRGFTISQLAVVVNALCGIYLLKDPSPGSRAARLSLAGCVMATIGAIVLGNLK